MKIPYAHNVRQIGAIFLCTASIALTGCGGNGSNNSTVPSAALSSNTDWTFSGSDTQHNAIYKDDGVLPDISLNAALSGEIVIFPNTPGPFTVANNTCPESFDIVPGLNVQDLYDIDVKSIDRSSLSCGFTIVDSKTGASFKVIYTNT